ncbi:MAG: GxxExxY protein [Phycisphaerales bacterium]|nr:GxxExxY protein [Phycisphaerales bacterium]
MRHEDLPEAVERVGHAILGCAIEVHRHLGPGLLEKLYEQALVYEIRSRGLSVEQQVEVTVPYKDIALVGQRIDLCVERLVIVELESVTEVLPVFRAQALSYLRAMNLPLGLIINFNVRLLKDGVSRIINERSPMCRVSASSPSRTSR